MNPTLQNILAVIAGLIIGSIANMALITLGPMIIPGPEGYDMTDPEQLKAAMEFMTPKNFIFPFLAHAFGTFVGAILAFKISKTHSLKMAMVVGVFFLAAGIANVAMLPSPLWFNVIDLVLAYIPMAYLGGKLMNKEA